ncbi:MAG: glycoside hydrolase family 3 protein, partial [Actinobacteria bacterium]|nr:glycoside hydrolase family 3 protein [Actinomycetota bacterium]
MGGNALIAIDGPRLDPQQAVLLSDPRVAGVTLYRHLNVVSAGQVFELARSLVESAGRRLLIALDQEGGQLIAGPPETTQFAGNRALGAAGDPALTHTGARAPGLELRAMGVNVDYAPVVDVATRPGNPSLGIRSFGEDPVAVGEMAAAFVTGLQEVGVAATLKHFPGKGEALVDPHDRLPVLDLSRQRLDTVELVPFRAGIDAGARLVMVGHYGLPSVTGDRFLPTSAAPQVLRSLLRDEMGFGGVVVTDALDMGGFAGLDAETPLDAGADLLLYGPRQTGALPERTTDGTGHLDDLHVWLDGFDTPDPSLVGCAQHRALAEELARRSITLVRDDIGLIPLNRDPASRVLTVMPRPADLTPADTSSLVAPGLAEAIKARAPSTTGLVVDREPTGTEIA